jgi:hypothetical protein
MRPRPIGAATLLVLSLTALQAGAGHAGTTAAPAVGTRASAVDLREIGGAVRSGGGWAVPLRAERPSWYTAELASQVDQANGAPVSAPVQAPLPGEIGIRPGAWMIAPYSCTMNFIFRKSGSYGIGTAGHCVDKLGQEVVLLTLAPGAGNPVLVEVGTVQIRKNSGIGADFALVSVRSQLDSWVDPTIAVVAGPCGAYSGSGPETVAHYGHGLVIGTGGTPRAGLALTWKGASFGWDGAAIFGDSGSPVRVTTLRAAGNLTHLVVDTRWLPSFIVGTRIGKMLSIAGGWNLVNSSLCP